MGGVSYLNYKGGEDFEIKDSPLLFIIPKEYFDEEKIKTLKVQDKINVKVLDTRIKFMSKQIQIIGEPVFDTN